ncbi:hypothetical protein D3C74_401870 [compost metagenome]
MSLKKRIIEPPICEFLNKRPYDLVHKIKVSWAEEEVDEEGLVIIRSFYSKTYCGLRLTHDKWDNRFVSEGSFNCKRCKKREGIK